MPLRLLRLAKEFLQPRLAVDEVHRQEGLRLLGGQLPHPRHPFLGVRSGASTVVLRVEHLLLAVGEAEIGPSGRVDNVVHPGVGENGTGEVPPRSA